MKSCEKPAKVCKMVKMRKLEINLKDVMLLQDFGLDGTELLHELIDLC
jgi:hypothetical protein